MGNQEIIVHKGDDIEDKLSVLISEGYHIDGVVPIKYRRLSYIDYNFMVESLIIVSKI